mmetsp:Transcript_88840/g.281173  ORF Transcript_88840/g.281173 Transcript_88840/m.281173 type:complete len:160 (-) Transcript_88840:328-807(-)
MGGARPGTLCCSSGTDSVKEAAGVTDGTELGGSRVAAGGDGLPASGVCLLDFFFTVVCSSSRLHKQQQQSTPSRVAAARGATIVAMPLAEESQSPQPLDPSPRGNHSEPVSAWTSVAHDEVKMAVVVAIGKVVGCSVVVGHTRGPETAPACSFCTADAS